MQRKQLLSSTLLALLMQALNGVVFLIAKV